MSRWLRFVVLSIVAHGILLALCRARISRVAIPKALPIKLRIVEMPVKAAATPAPVSAAAVAPLRQARPRASARKPSPVIDVAAPTSAAARASKSYAELFPSVADGLAHAERIESARRSAAGSFDPEGDAYPHETQLKNLARLDQFAAALANRISVPSSLKKMAPSGNAYVRLTKAAEGWKVANASGDPYYRALLFEVLASQPAEGYLFHLLDDTGYPTVRIYFSLAPVRMGDETAQPLLVRTASNKVFLDFTHVYVDETWQMATAWNNSTGAGVVGLEFIGVANYLWDKAHATGAVDDIDVKRLRLSPAFLRPIGR